MTRLLTRENVKLGVVAVACLLIAWTGPSVAHGVHAKFAHNADKVDGKHAVPSGASLTQAKGKLVAHNKQGQLPDKFVGKPDTIVTTHAGSGWQRHGSGPTTLQNYTAISIASAGSVALPLQAPHALGTARYGLARLEICYQRTEAAFITNTAVVSTDAASDPLLYSDNVDRTTSGYHCYTVAVGKRAPFGAGVTVDMAGGGTLVLRGVRATWTRAAAAVAPR